VTVLSLCDRTGVMVRPWLEAGHDCIVVDLQHEGVTTSGRMTRVGADVRDWWPPEDDYEAVFAFPPCTHLAVSGARWFRDKGLGKLIDALTIVERCRNICDRLGAPWMLENPVGVLSSYWRDPDFIFDPYEFAGWAQDPDAEAYTKRTCLWVGHGWQPPIKRPVAPTLGSLFHKTPPSADRGDIRSVTPSGFAYAVYAANAPSLAK
jgi:hypothetical protein